MGREERGGEGGGMRRGGKSSGKGLFQGLEGGVAFNIRPSLVGLRVTVTASCLQEA